MGAFLDTPMTTKEVDTGEGQGMKWAVSSMQGWRVNMEDAHSAITNIPALPGCAFFGVFDGHAGEMASKKCATGLLDTVLSKLPKKASGLPSPAELTAALTEGFISFDASLEGVASGGVGGSGTTAVTCLVTPSHIVVANCGDSRIVVSRGTGELWGSEDHKPTNEEETKRISAAGGFVAMGRVNGSLAVSRALGDFDFKRRGDLPAAAQQVSAEPTCTVLDRHDGDEFIVLCCDGIWDVMTNAEVIEYVREEAKLRALVDVANGLLDSCLERLSRDNMTACVVALPAATVSSAPPAGPDTTPPGDSGTGGSTGAAAFGGETV